LGIAQARIQEPTPGSRVALIGKDQLVRILGNGSPVQDLLIFLSRPEASELRDAIDALLENVNDAGWHAHVSSADYQTEITVAPDALA
jgi:hypothetical protein